MNRTLSQSRDVQIYVSLSKLTADKRNPRRVKPERDAHRRMVASIRAYGLLQPLVVRADDEQPGHFKVIAGKRRLAGLRDVHRDAAKPPKVPCVLRAVDDITADALALAENYIREPMHPLDEAEAFAKLAREEAKGVEAIAAEFGVSQFYVRQRMKLDILAEPIKAAYRQGDIDTATAEAFASVPPDRQMQVLEEVGGKPQHAQQVRGVIAHEWIDAGHALFDRANLPEGTVSSDLFNNQVLIERKAFMASQAEALMAERQSLVESGWSEVVVGPQADIQDRLYAMSEADKEFDKPTTTNLEKLAEKRGKLESKITELESKPGEFSEPDQKAYEAIQGKLEALDDEEQKIIEAADVLYSEATKAIGTVFLVLDPDGRVRREYRVPRSRGGASDGNNGHAAGVSEAPKPPTPDDLKDGQLGTTFTHQALAVRQALLKNDSTRKRVLALILHEKVRSEALAIRHDANGSTVHADNTEGFTSAALDALRQQRAKLDPLHDKHVVEEGAAYAAMQALSDKKVDALIDLMTVECLTAHLQRRTDLVWRLADELGVNIREYWRPDERWLAGYQKIQLAHLIGELRGPAYVTGAEQKKKSELIAELAKLFTDAAEGRMEDGKLAVKANGWLPSNLRKERQTDAKKRASAA